MGAVTDGEAARRHPGAFLRNPQPPPRPPHSTVASGSPWASLIRFPSEPRGFPAASHEPFGRTLGPLVPLGAPLTPRRPGQAWEAVLGGSAGGGGGGVLRALVGAWEGWKRCAGGWYPEGVWAVGECGEKEHLMGVVGSEQPQRGESGGGPGSGDLEGLWRAGNEWELRGRSKGFGPIQEGQTFRD